MKKMIVVFMIIALYLSGCQSNNSDAQNSNENNFDDTGEINHKGDAVDENSLTENDDEKGESEEISSDNENVDTTEYDNIKVSVTDAFDVFIDKFPNAKINEIELEQ